MKNSDYLYLTKTRLTSNKKQTITACMIVAFAVAMMILLSSVTLSLAHTGFKEMQEMSVLFEFYINKPDNAIYKLVNAVFYLSLIFEFCIVFAYFYNITYKRKKECRDKVIMGAKISNIVIENLLSSFVIFVVGSVFGCVSAYLLNTIIGSAIIGEVILLNLHLYAIGVIVGFCSVILGSVLSLCWTDFR